MGKSAPAPPPAPDYVGAAKEQGAANLTAATQSSVLGNPNVNGPLGSQNVSYSNYNGPDGQSYLQPTITQQLTPEAQQALQQQQQVQAGLASLANQGLGNAQSILSQQFNPQLTPLTTSIGDHGQASGNIGPYGQVTGQIGNAGPIARNIDTSGVAAMPITPGTTAQQAIMARLQPQIDQQNKALQQQLANQGLTAGGEAYDNAERIQNQSNNDLQSQAALQGIGLDLTANQQGYNQAAQNASFTNQAQQQRYNQMLGQGQFANQAVAQNYNQQLGTTQLQNQAIGQNYNQALQNAQFGNQAAQQSLQQQLGLYDQPLNQITALMSGSQIQLPQFQGYTGSNVNAAPIANAYTQQGQYAQNSYAQQVANVNSQNALFGDLLGGIGSAAGGGFFGKIGGP